MKQTDRSEGARALPLDEWVRWATAFEVTTVTVAATWPRHSGAHLDAPLNVVVRGLLGDRLRDLRCLTRAPTCDGCTERARCDYGTLFDGPERGVAMGEGGARSVQPFWLQGLPATDAPLAGQSHVARLFAIAPALPALPYFEVSLRDALSRLGAGSGPDNGGPTLGATRIDRIQATPPRRDCAGTTLRLTARTPLLLRGDEAVCREACPQAPWLALLLRSGVRRLDRLRTAIDPLGENPRADFPRLDRIEVLEGGLRTWRASRFSQRQGRRMPLSGLTGSAVIRGAEVGEIAALLLALTVTSVGKQTTMGFGDVGVEVVA